MRKNWGLASWQPDPNVGRGIKPCCNVSSPLAMVLNILVGVIILHHSDVAPNLSYRSNPKPVFNGHHENVNALQFNPDLSLLLSGGMSCSWHINPLINSLSRQFWLFYYKLSTNHFRRLTPHVSDQSQGSVLASLRSTNNVQKMWVIQWGLHNTLNSFLFFV